MAHKSARDGIVLDTGVVIAADDRRDADPETRMALLNERAAAELVARYADMSLGLIDAAVARIAERPRVRPPPRRR